MYYYVGNISCGAMENIIFSISAYWRDPVRKFAVAVHSTERMPQVS